MTALWHLFAQKSRNPRGYPPLRYGDAMRDATLASASQPHSPAPHHTAARPVPEPSHGPALRGRPVPPRPRDRRTLTRADWIGAALDALARDGLRAVAVEPLAERLGATKGSFYGHFRDRNALLEASVTQWERTATDEVLAALEPIADPHERQRATAAAFAGSERDIQIFLVLLWNADHPVIGPAVDRVLSKRMAFSQRFREEAGHSPEQARASMLYSYSLYLGVLMLRRAAPGMIPESGTPDGLRDYGASLIKQAAEGFLASTAS